jgi:hypothetical protein
MSYYPMNYSMTDPGTPFWWNAPVPSWGMNPMAAGSRRVGVGALGRCGCAAVGQDPRVAEDTAAKYEHATWGHVAFAAAGGLVVGLVIGHFAGKRSKTAMRRNGRGSYTANARWSQRYKNQLPDSHFFYVAPGGRKVRTTRGTFTIPKSKRKLPYVNLSGRVDASHVRNAISRAGQRKTDIPAAEKRRIQARARRLLASSEGVRKAA